MSCSTHADRNRQVTESAVSDDPEALARQYGPLVFKAAYRVLGEASLAEDVQQDVFLRLIETRYGSTRHGSTQHGSMQHGSVTSWPAYLTASATRAAIDVLRRQRRWWRLLPLWRMHAPTEAPSAEDTGLARERAQGLRAALAGLPRREAQCFGLRYLQDLDIGEIARVLEMTENNVHVTLHRARRRLEARLGDHTTEAMP
jgi:RNA polymerase sigma factor (sigma-70 family)